MKPTVSLLTAALILPAGSVMAQMTGTSHPEQLNDVVVTTSAQTSTHYTKPSPAIPATPITESTTTLRTREYAAPSTVTTTTQVSSNARTPLPVQPDLRTGERLDDEDHFTVTDDPNSGVVTEVEWHQNEVPEGTLLRARLSSTLR